MNNLSVTLLSADDKVKFSAASRENPQVVVDYFPPLGTGQGYTSLELLMVSLGSCIGTTLLTLLRHRMRKNVTGMAVTVDGRVREEHPKKLDHIKVSLRIKANDLSEQDVMSMLKVAEESVCPVWAMLKGNVVIDVAAEIEK